MAGVPLLNGFLSKEMFFAEALEVERTRCRGSIARCPTCVTLAGDVQRRLFAALHPRRVLRPDPVGLPRDAARTAALDALSDRGARAGLPGRRHASRRQTIGPFLDVAVASVLGDADAALQPRGLARLHPAAADERGRARRRRRAVLSAAAQATSPRGDDGPPLLPPIDGAPRLRARAGDAVVALARAAWRAGSARAGCSRNCAGSSASRSSPRLWPIYATAASVLGGPADTAAFDSRCSRCCGWSVASCALAAAMQAKFHRLVALILAGGAGLVTCMTFVWFSAPDLALTQLLVEIVTTVLLLLGLRWLPKRLPQRGRWTGALAALPRRAARPRDCRRRPAAAWRRSPMR